MHKKEYAIIKLHRRQGDCEVTGEVFESTYSRQRRVEGLLLIATFMHSQLFFGS